MDLLDRLSSGWKAWMILFAITFTAAAPGVFQLPALDRDESRFAQASKQYIETGDYLVIRYQDEFRNKKPAGIHWLQSGATHLLGDDDKLEIWTYRVPSWLGAVFATLATFWCGVSLIGRRAAFLGSALFGATILLTSEAHIAKTDAVLVFVTTLGVGALARLYMADTRHPKGLALLFWFAMGCGLLIKGPVTPMVAAYAGLGAWLWTKISAGRGGDWWKPLAWWPGPLLALIMFVPWLIAIQVATGGTFLEGAVGKDLKDKVAGASEGHAGWPLYHMSHLPVWFFPAVLLLIPGSVLAFQKLRGLREHALERGSDEIRALRFIVAWGVLNFLFFELLPTKLSHYVLPSYPAFGLLCGWAGVKLIDGIKLPVSKWLSFAVYMLGGGLLLFVSSPIAARLVKTEAAGDFKTAVSDTVLAQWASALIFPMYLWWIGGAVFVLSLAVFFARRIGLASVFAIATSLFLGWHVRTYFIPAQLWVQPTESVRLALQGVCGVPGETCEGGAVSPDRVLAVGYAEPSYVMTLGTQNLHPPETPTVLPNDAAAYPVVYLVNLEDRGRTSGACETLGEGCIAPAVEIRDDLLAQADRAGLCVTQSDPVYALNYSNGDPVHFVAYRFESGC